MKPAKNIKLYGKLLLPKEDIFWMNARRRRQRNICYIKNCLYCTRKRRCTILKKTYPKEKCPFCKIEKKENFSNFCDRTNCINCSKKRKKCKLLKFTDKRKNCPFFKTNEQTKNESLLLTNRIKQIYKEHNGKSIISSILKQHPEITLIPDEEIQDIILKVREYERRYHFEYKNPKVFSMPDKW